MKSVESMFLICCFFFEVIKKCTFEIIVDAPVISLPAKTYNVTEGADIELLCPSAGRPPPNVTWLKTNGLKNNSYPSGQVLNISNTNRIETGEYQCTAKNGVGKEAKATIYLNVICKF